MRILSLDPGLASGFIVAELFDDKPLTLSSQGVIDGGCEGFLDWVKPGCYLEIVDTVICERFVIDGTHTGVWSPQIEGAVMALSPVPIVWQLRSDKATLFGQKQKGAKGETERFNWLRERGFSGEGHELDAITHALVWAKRSGHKPTIDKYWG